MPSIPYPDVPNYPGVPSIPRTGPGLPQISLSLVPNDVNQQLAIGASTPLPQWGIYEAGTVIPLYEPTAGGTLSTFSVGQDRGMMVSDFPVEAGPSGQGAAFASFNKVWRPATPIVVLSMDGSEAEKSAFLAAIDAASQSTDLWDVYTPDATYQGYTVERYGYQRSAMRGASLLMVEVSLKQILQVSPSYSNVSLPQGAINSPQSPSAVNPVNNGLTQPGTPSSSILYDLGNSIDNFLGANN